MISDLIQVFKEFGVEALIMSILALLLFSGYNTYLRQLIMANLLGIKSKKPKDLRHHRFFANIRHIQYFELHTMDLCEDYPIRNKMFKKLLEIALDTYCAQMESVVSTKIDSDDYNQWGKTLRATMYKIIETIRMKALAEGIPEPALVRFEKWHSPHVSDIYDHISTLTYSSYVETTRLKTVFFLYYLETYLTAMLAEATSGVFCYLNGKMSGLKYNNETLE